jgi:hypothetical protein
VARNRLGVTELERVPHSLLLAKTSVSLCATEDSLQCPRNLPLNCSPRPTNAAQTLHRTHLPFIPAFPTHRRLGRSSGLFPSRFLADIVTPVSPCAKKNIRNVILMLFLSPSLLSACQLRILSCTHPTVPLGMRDLPSYGLMGSAHHSK